MKLSQYMQEKVKDKFIKVDRNFVRLMLLTGENLWGTYLFMSLIAGQERICKYSQAGLARRLDLSERTIKRIFKQLQHIGLIEGDIAGTNGVTELSGDKVDTDRGYRILPVTEEKVRRMTELSGDKVDTAKRGQHCPKRGDNIVQKGVTELSKKKEENSLQHLESIPEIGSTHGVLLDLYLLDHSIRSNKQTNNCADALEFFLRIKPKKENYRKYTQLSDDSRHAIDATLVDLFPESLPCLKSFVTYHIWMLVHYYAEQHGELYQKALVNFDRLLGILQLDESLEKLTRYMVQQYMYICFDKSEYYHKFIESGQTYKWAEKYHRKIYDKLAIVGNSFVGIYRTIITNSD